MNNFSTNNRLVIAIDGPAASGKGTLARKLAAHLQLPHLDTGKLYRSIALALIRSGSPRPYTREDAINYAENIDISLFSDPELALETTGEVASFVSAIPGVRSSLLAYQRNFAMSGKGAVLDGRDIGTIICPDAQIKLYVTASLESRAKRRFNELQSKGIDVIYPAVLEDLRARDIRDQQREVAPLVPAEDSLVLDTTTLSAEEVFSEVLKLL